WRKSGFKQYPLNPEFLKWMFLQMNNIGITSVTGNIMMKRESLAILKNMLMVKKWIVFHLKNNNFGYL
ncbi:MAG: hypothetical protein ACOVRK_01100, partial [Chryseobacterium taeanense]